MLYIHRLLIARPKQPTEENNILNVIVINENIDKLHSGDFEHKSVTLMVNSFVLHSGLSSEYEVTMRGQC